MENPMTDTPNFNLDSHFCPQCRHPIPVGGRGDGGRESIWSVSAAWKTAFFSIFSVSTLITTIAIIAYQIANRGDAAIMETHRSTAEWVFINGAAQALAIYATTETWETIMVLANHLRQRLLEPLKERQRMEGRAESDAAWRAWNARREKAAESGEPFDEPPPSFGG